MSRGKRYDNKPKLNMKKVVAVIVAFVLIIMFGVAIKSLLSSDSSASKLVSTTYFVINKDSKWGVIDNNGKTIIYPTYEDAIIIPNNKQPIFICTYDVNYEDLYVIVDLGIVPSAKPFVETVEVDITIPEIFGFSVKEL